MIGPSAAVAVCEIVMAPSGVTAPIVAEVVVILPVPLANVRFCVPLTELEIVIFPAPVPLFREVAAAKVMGPAKLMAELAVMIFPPIVTGPAPLWLKGPFDWIFPDAVEVKVPRFPTVIPPVPLAVQAAPRVMAVPVKLMPSDPLVMIGPLKVEATLPAVCVIEEAVMAWAMTLAADVMEMSPKGVVLPTAELRTTLPVPAAKLSGFVPSIVPAKRMSPAPAPELNPPGAKSVIGLEKEIL